MSDQNQDKDPKLNPPDGDESQTTTVALPQLEPPQKCPRCNSADTKFCYYNNYSLSQPRYYCKTCRRYWTRGGSLRNIPVGGRRAKCSRIATTAATTSSSPQQQQQQQLCMLPSNAGFNISSTEMGPYNFPGEGFPSPFATVPPLMSLSGPPRFTPAGFSLFQGFGSLGFGRVVQGTGLYHMCSSVPEASLWSGSAAAGTTNSGNTTVNVPTHSAPSAASFNPTQGSGFPGFGGP